MSATALTATSGSPRNIVPWLAVAILLHALLLLIPYHVDGERDSVYRKLSLSFKKPVLERPVKPAPPTRTEPAPGPPEARHEAVPPARSTAPANVQSPPDDISRDDLPELPSTARLLDSASELRWKLPGQRAPRRLGVFTPPDIPENWKNRIRIEDNRFDDAVVPGRTVIVDRWLAADGSHNVVVETPGGHTLCGRVEAWDPMNPLLVHVMQYRRCGGGGERTFRMPERYGYRKDLSGAASWPRYR